MKEKMSSSSPSDMRLTWAVLLCGFLSTLGVGLLSFAVPLVSLDAKISGMWLGTGFAGFFLARLLVGPLGGLWADRSGARTPLLWGFGVGSFVPLVYMAHPSMAALFLIQFMLGCVAGLVRPVGLAALGARAQSRSKWFQLHTVLFNLAIFIGPFLGGLLYWNRFIEPVLVGVTVCMVIAHLLAFAFVPKTVSTRTELQESDTPSRDAKRFKGLLVAIFGRTFGIGLLMAFYPILLSVRLNADGLVVGCLFSVIGLTTCLGLPFGGWLKRQDGYDPIVIGMLTSGVGLMGAGVGVNVWHFVLAGVVMGFGSALSIPEAMAQASASMRNQGRVFGITHLVTGMGFLAGPLFGGMVVQLSGDVGQAFFVAGLIGLACLAVWAQYGRGGRDALPSKSTLAILFIVGISGAWLMAGSEKDRQDGLYRYTDVAMGTVVNLTLEAGSQKAADDAARKAISLMRYLQQDYDFRSVDGSIGRINRAAGKTWVKPSNRAYDLLQRTLEFSAQTGGVFDPTIGAATTSPLYFALDESLLASKKDLVDYRLVMLDKEGGRVRLSKEGMALDLGGVAKGTIIDATVSLLRKLGVTAGIVEAGGDFYCFGDRDWVVGVRHPRGEEVKVTVSVREKGVCGSGDYEQFVLGEQDGREQVRHHILDPTDMSPAKEALGVTVIASSAEHADRLATALFIMGAKEGKRFLSVHWPDDAAMWFNPDLSVDATKNFPK